MYVSCWEGVGIMSLSTTGCEPQTAGTLLIVTEKICRNQLKGQSYFVAQIQHESKRDDDIG